MNHDDRSFLSIGAFIFGVIALLFGGYALASSPEKSTTTVTSAGTAPAVVDINMSEFMMTPAMVTVPEGDITVRVTNSGTIVHNLTFVERNVATRNLNPGESETLTLKNVAKGTLNYSCLIPGHA